MVLSISVEKHILLIGCGELAGEGERRKDEEREGRGGDERGGRQSEEGEYEANHAALLHAIYTLSFYELADTSGFLKDC